MSQPVAPGTPPLKSVKRQRIKKSPKPSSGTAYDPARDSYALRVWSGGHLDCTPGITLTLTAPEPGEECTITMEPIAEYRLPFVPDTFKKQWLIKGQPALTKATLPCGHGFSALALVYHFLKNSMTCPCCRAGRANERMGEQFVPAHMRRFFSKQLARCRTEEEQEQIATDAVAAAQMLHYEVSYEILALPVTRLVLSLYAYSSPDRSSSPEPTLALELPLTSSLTTGTMECVSYGYSLHQLNLNLGILPMAISAFELGIGVRSLHQHELSSVALFRTVRFSVPEEDAATRNGNIVMPRLIPAAGGDPRLNIEVRMLHTRGVGNPQFARIAWQIGVQEFTDLLVDTSRALAMAPAEMAAV